MVHHSHRIKEGKSPDVQQNHTNFRGHAFGTAVKKLLGAPTSHAGTPQVELGIRFCSTACTLRGNNDGSSTLVPTSNVGNPVWVLGSLLCPVPALAVAGIWEISQWRSYLSFFLPFSLSCLSAFQMIFSKFINGKSVGLVLWSSGWCLYSIWMPNRVLDAAC